MSTDLNSLWRMCTDAGQIFGPVPFSELLKWVQEGRIAANYLLTSDGQQWISPADIPELEMRWIVELAPNKFFGPAHQKVVDELKQSPEFAGVRLYTLPDPTADARFDQLRRENEALVSERDQHARLAQNIQARALELEQALAGQEALQAQTAQALEEVRQTLQTEVQARTLVQAELTEIQALREQELNTFQATRDDLQNQLAQARDTIQTLQAQLAQAQEKEVQIEVVDDIEVLAPDTPPKIKPRPDQALHNLEQRLADELKRAAQSNRRFF